MSKISLVGKKESEIKISQKLKLNSCIILPLSVNRQPKLAFGGGVSAFQSACISIFVVHGMDYVFLKQGLLFDVSLSGFKCCAEFSVICLNFQHEKNK